MGGAGGIIGSKYKMGGEGSVGLLLLPPTLNVVSATTITLPSISSPVSISLLLLVFILSLSCFVRYTTLARMTRGKTRFLFVL